MSEKIDLTGKRFGRLVAIKETKERRNGHVMWKCKCDCGKIIQVRNSSLLTRNTESCGCLQKEKAVINIRNSPTHAEIHNLIGRRFGRLMVVQLSGVKGNTLDRYWDCTCDCGNHKTVIGINLLNDDTQSCGCLRKEQLHNREKEWLEGTYLSALTSKKSKSNSSGIKGVSWFKQSEKWKAYICFKNKYIHLGLYAKIEDAAKARKEAEEKYFVPILDKYGRLEGKEDEQTKKSACKNRTGRSAGRRNTKLNKD